METAFTVIGQFFTDIFRFFTDFIQWLINLIIRLFDDVWSMVTDFFVWIFDKIADLVVSILTTTPAIIFPDLWALLPFDVANMLGLIGIAPALALIISSLGIRFLLQLIPFTRLGS